MIPPRQMMGLAILTACLVGSQEAAAQSTTWVSVKDLMGASSICLDISGKQIDYTVLGPGDEAHGSDRGPRRLKLICRYLFAPQDGAQVPFTVVVEVDGREERRERFVGTPHEHVTPCDSEQRVSRLERAYVNLPFGRHKITLRVETEGSGAVAVRLFRQVRQQSGRWVTQKPEIYGELRHLQFESGSQSVYYQFTSEQPLRIPIIGPTRLRLRTRLDFDYKMKGTQQYSLKVLLDGIPLRTHHFDCTALSSAAYVERPDILPGVRRTLDVEIPSGRHTVEVYCLRPDNCSVAAMLHIPKRDVRR